MRKVYLLLVAGALGLVAFENVHGQDADTLDVPPGFETLNLAVQGDTLPGGGPKNPNRVYRLERGGYYLLNGELRNIKGAALRVVAAKGEGPMPIIIPAVTEAGAAGRAFRPGSDGVFKGLYVSGIDNLGNQAEKNMFRCDGKGARIIIDGCFLDHDAQSFVRMNAEGQKLYVTNTIMRNTIDLASTGNGRYIDTRSNTQDTIFVQNCTLYLNSSGIIRTADGIVKNLIFDHVTHYQGDGQIESHRTVNARITNSLFVDFGFEGDTKPSDPAAALADSIEESLLPIDTLAGPEVATEEQRNIVVKNNVYGWTPQLLAWINGIDTVVTWVFHDVRTRRFFATYPNMISENNIEEYPVFSDAPDPAPVIAFADHRRKTNFSDEGNPDPRADRNGIAPLTENPNSFGPAQDEYDFSYSTSSRAYTHAEGGFPVGDLNWFPDRKREWETWVSSVDWKEDAVPAHLALQRNYPNPFNPSTTIVYRLARASTARLTVYNALGQRVRTLVDRVQPAGEYSVQWDGLDDNGRSMASGLYLCRLEAENQVQTMKMLMLK